VSLIERPRRGPPRVFVEAPPSLSGRVHRALGALGDLPAYLDLPGRPDVTAALTAVADALDDGPGEDEAPLPLFAWARGRPP